MGRSGTGYKERVWTEDCTTEGDRCVFRKLEEWKKLFGKKNFQEVFTLVSGFDFVLAKLCDKFVKF